MRVKTWNISCTRVLVPFSLISGRSACRNIERGPDRPPRHIGSPALTISSFGGSLPQARSNSGTRPLKKASMSLRRTTSPLGPATLISMRSNCSRRVPTWPAMIQPVGRSKRRSGFTTTKDLPSRLRLNGVSTLVQPLGSWKRRRARESAPGVAATAAGGIRWSPRTITQSSVMRAS